MPLQHTLPTVFALLLHSATRILHLSRFVCLLRRILLFAGNVAKCLERFLRNNSDRILSGQIACLALGVVCVSFQPAAAQAWQSKYSVTNYMDSGIHGFADWERNNPWQVAADLMHPDSMNSFEMGMRMESVDRDRKSVV